jgi:hypothetical protein
VANNRQDRADARQQANQDEADTRSAGGIPDAGTGALDPPPGNPGRAKTAGDDARAAEAADRANRANELDPLREPPEEGYEKSTSRAERAPEEKEKLSQLRSEQAGKAKELGDARKASEEAARKYEIMKAEARERNDKILQIVGKPAKRPTTIVEYSAQRKAKGEKLVPVLIPKPFTFRLDDHSTIDVLAGVRQVPESLADHWWFAANGATPADGA